MRGDTGRIGLPAPEESSEPWVLIDVTDGAGLATRVGDKRLASCCWGVAKRPLSVLIGGLGPAVLLTFCCGVAWEEDAVFGGGGGAGKFFSSFILGGTAGTSEITT